MHEWWWIRVCSVYVIDSMCIPRLLLCSTFPMSDMSLQTIIEFITSLAKEVMFLVALVSLSVCLFVCLWTTLLKKL